MKGLILFLSFFAVGIFIAWADDQAISPSEVKQWFDIRPMYADVGAIPAAGACNTAVDGCPGFSGAATGSTNCLYPNTPIAQSGAAAVSG